jgi:hypothetical protein
MNGMDSIAGPNALPNVIDVDHYYKYVEAIKNEADKTLFKDSYAHDINSKTYKLSLPSSSQECAKLWDIFFDINKSHHTTYGGTKITAYYIHDHRLKFKRDGNENDDWLKAEYLLNLLKYFKQKRTRVILLQQDDELEELIDMVNNIFDSAYFKKKNYPDRSDSECFFEAEREYCEEKYLDYLAYQEYLRRISTQSTNGDEISDYINAKNLFFTKEIESIAYQLYKERYAKQITSDPLSDWNDAESLYPKLRMTKRIATICWNRSKKKDYSPDHYWLIALSVIQALEAFECSYMEKNPSRDDQIKKIIMSHVSLVDHITMMCV